MPDPTADATILVAPGSAAITWEVATIVSEALSALGLRTRVGRPETVAEGTPLIIVGHGASVSPPISEALARRAIIIVLAGPGTQAFGLAVGLSKVAAGCFAVSSRTVVALRAQGVRTERFVLGYADRWDTGGAASRPKPIDIIYPGEVDDHGRGLLARVAFELPDMRSHINLAARWLESSAIAPAFESSLLLADARLTLNLRCWDETTLDWATTVRAMCNGCVVIAERVAGCGELVPGEHFLMARAENIGPVIRAAVADPQTVAGMATAAYEFCRTDLAMGVSLERLATASGRSRGRLRLRHRDAQAAVTSSGPQTRDDSQTLKLNVVRRPSGEDLNADAEVDLICVDHRDTGPISLTQESLTGHQFRLNLHVGTIGTTERHQGLLSEEAAFPIGTAVAAVRNDLVGRTSAPLVMFINSGDQVLTSALSCLAAAFGSSTQPDICMAISALGTDDLAYPWLWESPQSTTERDVPQHGYMVRRAYLDRIGPFVGGEGDAVGPDHEFWRRAAAIGGRVALLPQVAVRVWQRT